MAQFDVYANPNRSTRYAYPYLLDIQHSVASPLKTRWVVPLGRLSDFRGEQLERLTPEVEYHGEAFLILMPQLASMPASQLKKPIGSLASMRDDIIAAIDFAVTGV